MIPKQIHFVWIGPPLPWWARANMDRFESLNPEYEVRLHGEEVLLDCFRAGYERIVGEHELSRKSDLLRISALLRCGGGWYFDSDYLPFRPISDFEIESNTPADDCVVVVGDDDVIANGIIGSAPQSAFLSVVTVAILDRIRSGGELSWDAFGPGIFTPAASRHASIVTVGKMWWFCPLQPRERSIAAYRRIAAKEFSHESIAAEFPDKLPFMMHMGMQDEVVL